MKKIIILLLIVIDLCLAFSIGYDKGIRNARVDERIDTIERLDTLYLPSEIKYVDVPRDRYVWLRDTIRMNDSIYQKLYADTITSISNDSLECSYRLIIASRDTFSTSVDSLSIRLLKVPYIEKERLIERCVTIDRTKRFIIGPYIGIGYDVNNNKISPSIGIGVVYNIWRK